MNSRRIVLWLVVAAALGSGGFAWWQYRQTRRQDVAILAAAVPPRPDLKGYSPELSRRIEQCEQRINANSRDAVAALGELSRLYHANGFMTEAMQGYRALVYLESGEARWAHLLATALSGYGDLEAAIPLWRHAAQRAPDYLPVALRLAETLTKTNEPTEAAEVLERVLRRDPGNPYALIGLARLDMVAERWTEARDRLEQAAAHPARLPAGDLLAKVYERLGDSARALSERRRPGAGETDFCDVPDPWVTSLTDECYDATQLVVMSAVSTANHDLATTRRRLERAVTVDPDNAYAQRQFGVFLAEHDEFARARASLERAVALAPKESDNWAKLIWLLNQVGDQPAAERALATGLQHCPNSPSLHLERGRRFKIAGKFPEALAALAEARRLRPQEVDAYIEAAEIHFRQNQLTTAADQLRAALAAVPEHPVALFLLARYTIDQGDESPAADLVRRARVQVKIRADELAALEEAFRQRFGRRP